jgi:hypothetical protein
MPTIRRERTASTASPKETPEEWRPSKFMLLTGEMEIAPPVPAGELVLRTAPATTTATTPSQRRSGQQPRQPCLTTRRSRQEPRLAPSTLTAPYWRKTGNDYPKNKPPSRDAYLRQTDLANDEEAHKEAPLEVLMGQANTDQEFPGSRKTMLEK